MPARVIKSPHFTTEQLRELQVLFDLHPRSDVYPVRDGSVHLDDYVWWRCEDGPQHVRVKDHLANLIEFPHLYQLVRPQTEIRYTEG